jgi:fructose-1,6-bisphosphatase/inositol monophosphatase family enzyme
MTAAIDPSAIAAEIARIAAEEIQPRFGHLVAGDIKEKTPNDFVTVADLAVERRLTAYFRELTPGALVVGEEACAADPALMPRLGDADLAWVVDPLDGTSNFTRAKRQIAVIVALVQRGEVIAGWIHDPLALWTAVAERGGGAWRDGTRLGFEERRRDTWPLGSVHVKYFPAEARRRIVAELRSVTAIDPLWCAGQEHLRVASGASDFAMFRRVLPWDHAAGALMVREAGGVTEHLEGGAYDVLHPDRGLIVGRCAETVEAVRERLFRPSLA